MTVNYGGISHISSSGNSSSGTGNSIAPHLGLPSLPQCIALGDRWTERKIKSDTDILNTERKIVK